MPELIDTAPLEEVRKYFPRAVEEPSTLRNWLETEIFYPDESRFKDDLFSFETGPIEPSQKRFQYGADNLARVRGYHSIQRLSIDLEDYYLDEKPTLTFQAIPRNVFEGSLSRICCAWGPTELEEGLYANVVDELDIRITPEWLHIRSIAGGEYQNVLPLVEGIEHPMNTYRKGTSSNIRWDSVKKVDKNLVDLRVVNEQRGTKFEFRLPIQVHKDRIELQSNV